MKWQCYSNTRDEGRMFWSIISEWRQRKISQLQLFSFWLSFVQTKTPRGNVISASKIIPRGGSSLTASWHRAEPLPPQLQGCIACRGDPVAWRFHTNKLRELSWANWRNDGWSIPAYQFSDHVSCLFKLNGLNMHYLFLIIRTKPNREHYSI